MKYIVEVEKWREPMRPQYRMYQSPSRVLRWMFYQRLEMAVKLAGVGKHKRVLDVGCWTGFFLPTLARWYGEVVAIENDQAYIAMPELWERPMPEWTALQLARELCLTEIPETCMPHLLMADAVHLPFADESFDHIFLLDIMEHMPDEPKRTMIHNLHRILRCGGSVVVSSPKEFGATLLARHAYGKISGHHRDEYTWAELMRESFFHRRPAHKTSDLSSHKGYDYRNDMELIHERFTIQAIRFVPLPLFSRLNPTVMYAAVKKS